MMAQKQGADKNFFGLPIQLWGRSGYVGNLVDYYDYSTSWSLGFELLSH
ncbi:MAG: hypothetical protein LBE21_04985 [Pseudomonadales bacterium]|nr:hypothetical protein [Pseudomonadales bacterium]